jgi:Outer membrane protein beta-barrel domain
MTTSRLISAGVLFSFLTFASCSSVQVPYDMPSDDPSQRSETLIHDAYSTDEASFTETTPTDTRTVADNETGEFLDLEPMPEPYFKKATGGSKVNLGLLIGARTRDSDDWSVLDDQAALGVEFSFIPKYFPIGVEVGILYAFTSENVGGFDVESTTAELYFGPRFEWSIPEGTLKFYAGGGASLIREDVEQIIGAAKQSFDDTTFGLYLHGGLELMLSKTFGVGFDLRGVWSEDATLNGINANPSYYQGAVLLGLHF